MTSAERHGADDRTPVTRLRPVAETVRPDNKAAYRLYQRFGFTHQCSEQLNGCGTSEPRKVLHRSLVANPYPASP